MSLDLSPGTFFFPRYELGLERQLVAGQAHGFLADLVRHAAQLEDDPAGPDDRHPVVGRALAGAHAGLGRLRGHRLVREDPDPDLAAALDVVSDDAPGGLDLAAGEPGALQRLDAKVAKGHGAATVGQPAALAAVLLAVLDARRQQHALFL